MKYAYGILFRDITEKAWSIGIFEFRSQSRVRRPQIWGAKIMLLFLFLLQFCTQGAESF